MMYLLMGSVDNKKNITPGLRNDVSIQLIYYSKCVLKKNANWFIFNSMQ